MAVKFTRDDLEVFQIPGFQARMKALRETIQPKLRELGEEVGPPLMVQFKREFFPHVAKHMRRTVNPPDETWVAMGPQSRGYKAYVYFAFCVGKEGAQARVMMKTESSLRPALGKNLFANQTFFVKRAKDFQGLGDYTKRKPGEGPAAIADIKQFLLDSSERLTQLKSAQFDVGLKVSPLSRSLSQDILTAWDLLFPFYECGLQQGVRFS